MGHEDMFPYLILFSRSLTLFLPLTLPADDCRKHGAVGDETIKYERLWSKVRPLSQPGKTPIAETKSEYKFCPSIPQGIV